MKTEKTTEKRILTLIDDLLEGKRVMFIQCLSKANRKVDRLSDSMHTS